MVFEEYKQKTENLVLNKGKSKTPTLDLYSRDLTTLAANGKLQSIIGRDEEIERISQILSRRRKNNPILVGDPGVGKTAIIEGLASKIISRKVPKKLLNKRLVSLDIGALVAGTKYRGEFEGRMKTILDELAEDDNTIVFIDEIHTIIGAGASPDSLDAANILKPALSRGEFQCIGSTTFNEYRKNIEKDGALERRFQKIKIDAPDFNTTISILNHIKSYYEDHHNVIFTDDAIYSCVKLTERYINDRNFPDKALDALDEAGSRTQIKEVVIPENIRKLEKNLEKVETEKIKARDSQKYLEASKYRDEALRIKMSIEVENKIWENECTKNKEVVDSNKIAEVVSMMAGIPLSKLTKEENTKLLDLDKELKKKVIGQDSAINNISRAIKRNRTGLKDPNRPIGAFLLSGPTGVGKTLLASVLADVMFDDPNALIRIDMSEYMEKFDVNKLIGAPPGYIGYGEGGYLTEKVRNKPYSIILFDEIEKAHPDIFNILLQIMDEGRITDSLGKNIDFKNTLILLTSNVGQRKIQEFGSNVGFNSNSNITKENKEENIIRKELEKLFAPEFLNRLDEIIQFKSLDRDVILKIIDIEVNKIIKRINDLGYKLELNNDIKEKIAEVGFDIKYGARPIKRVIQRYIEDAIADLMIENNIIIGSKIVLSYDDKKDFDCEPPVKIKIIESKKEKRKNKIGNK